MLMSKIENKITWIFSIQTAIIASLLFIFSGCTQNAPPLKGDMARLASTLDRGAETLGLKQIAEHTQRAARGGLAFKQPDSNGYTFLPPRDGGLPCKVQFPSDFFLTTKFLRYPTKLSDFKKVTVSDRRCGETANNYPRTHSDSGSRIKIWTNYTMNREYSQRINPEYSEISFSISGPMKEGIYHEETRIVMNFSNQKGKDISNIREALDLLYAHPPIQDSSIDNPSYKKVFVSNGKFLKSRSEHYANRDAEAGYHDLFSVKLSFYSDSDGEITEANAARLLSAKGGFSDYKVKYTIAPKPNVKSSLTSAKYNFNIHTRVELVMESKPGGFWGVLVSSIDKKVLEKDFEIDVSKDNGYRASGSKDIGKAMTSGNSNIVIFNIDQKLKSATPTAYVKDFHPT